MNIKIIAKRTGIGNQIQFIPCIRELQKNHYVYTDSDVYEQLGVLRVENITEPDECYMVFNYSRNKVIREKIKYPRAKFHGYVGKDSQIAKMLIDEWRIMDHNNTELWNNKKFVPTEEPLHIDGWEPFPDTVALLVSNKWNKDYKYWNKLANILDKSGWDVFILGDKIQHHNYINTPTIKALKRCLCYRKYYIGTDNGATHLADALGLKGITIWGDSKLRGATVNGHIVMGLNAEPYEIYKIFKEKVEDK